MANNCSRGAEMSFEGNQSDSSLSEYRPTRVGKACDTCRARKLKCDGLNPCLRCKNSSISCTYNYVEKKRSSGNGGKRQKTVSVKDLDERLLKLENLIGKLVDKVSVPQQQSNNTNESISVVSNNQDNNNTNNYLPQHNESQHKVSNSHTLPPAPLDKSSAEEGPDCSGFVGSQATYSIFSPHGMQWIANKTSKQESKTVVANLLERSFSILYVGYRRWSDPISETSIVPLPPKEIFVKLVEVYDNALLPIASIVTGSEILDLYENYLTIQNGITQPTRKIGYSEMLILYMTVVISCGTILELDNAGVIDNTNLMKTIFSISKTSYLNMILQKNEQNHLAGETHTEFLKEVESAHLITALFYFQRVSNNGQGTNSIKATMMLIRYVWLTLPGIEYQSASVCIRLSQAFGLHRLETLTGLSEEEIRMRRSLWTWCFIFDKELCLKCGKPPMIYKIDNSVLDFKSTLTNLRQFTTNPALSKVLNLPNMDLNNWLDFEKFIYHLIGHDITNVDYFESLMVILCGVFSDAYELLFSADAAKKNEYEIIQSVGELNDRLSSFAQMIPVFIRPGKAIKLPFVGSDVDDKLMVKLYSIKLKVLDFHYYYHLISSIINRNCFKNSWDVSDDNDSIDQQYLILRNNYLSIGLNNSREVLKLTEELCCSSFQYLNRVLFIVCASFITVFITIIEDPKRFQSRQDIFLLIRVVECYLENIMKTKYELNPNRKLPSGQKYLLVTYTIKTFTEISIDHFNNHCDSEASKIEYKFKKYQHELEVIRLRIEDLYAKAVADKDLEQKKVAEFARMATNMRFRQGQDSNSVSTSSSMSVPSLSKTSGPITDVNNSINGSEASSSAIATPTNGISAGTNPQIFGSTNVDGNSVSNSGLNGTSTAAGTANTPFNIDYVLNKPASLQALNSNGLPSTPPLGNGNINNSTIPNNNNNNNNNNHGIQSVNNLVNADGIPANPVNPLILDADFDVMNDIFDLAPFSQHLYKIPPFLYNQEN